MESPNGDIKRRSLADLRGKNSIRISGDDPMIPPMAAEVRLDCGNPQEPRYWIRSLSPAAIRMGDLECREAQWPPHLTVKMGSTSFVLTRGKERAAPPESPSGSPTWLTKDPKGVAVLQTTRNAAGTLLPTYLCGETGVGKEILAQLVHAWSGCAQGPFVPLHCAALPLSLAESELFGHVRGSFTGATHQRPGALLQAHNGTLFLDEIGDLPPEIQVKLLRFLENGEIRAVGSDRTTRVNVRVVSASHHSLKKLVEKGVFRQDLYYRIACLTIEVPPLRERPEDIRFLTERFAALLHRQISESAAALLSRHSWPGNVRELKHALERAAGFSPSPCLLESDFDFLPRNNATLAPAPQSAPLKLREMERSLLMSALHSHQGNRTLAAKDLGISRSTVFEMIRRHRIHEARQFTMKLLK